MARRELKTHQLLKDDGSEIDLDASFTTEETQINGIDRFCYQVEWSGTTVSGEFFVDVSLGTPGPDSQYSDIWEPLDFGGVSILASADTGSHIIEVVLTSAKKARLRYVRSTGTGSITARIGGTVEGS